MDIRRLAAGAASGLAATAVMSGWMAAGQLTGRHGEQPPKRLIRRLGRRLGVPTRRFGGGLWLASAAAHAGFGATCGAAYAAAVRRSSAGRGVAFGLGVWAASYAGWIPALDLLPPPHRDNPRRAWTVFTAHVVYGAVLGATLDRTGLAALTANSGTGCGLTSTML